MRSNRTIRRSTARLLVAVVCVTLLCINAVRVYSVYEEYGSVVEGTSLLLDKQRDLVHQIRRERDELDLLHEVASRGEYAVLRAERMLSNAALGDSFPLLEYTSQATEPNGYYNQQSEFDVVDEDDVEERVDFEALESLFQQLPALPVELKPRRDLGDLVEAIFSRDMLPADLHYLERMLESCPGDADPHEIELIHANTQCNRNDGDGAPTPIATGHKGTNSNCWPSPHSCNAGNDIAENFESELARLLHGDRDLSPLALGAASLTKFRCGCTFVEVYSGDGRTYTGTGEGPMVKDTIHGRQVTSTSELFESHSRWLEDTLGWRGIVIESLNSSFTDLRRQRPAATRVHAAIGPDESQLVFELQDSGRHVDNLKWEDAWTSARRRFTQKWDRIYESGEQVKCRSYRQRESSLESICAQSGLSHIDVLVVNAVGGEYDIVSTIATSNLVSVSHVLVVDPEWRNTLGEQMRGLGFQPSYLLRRDFVAFSRSLTDAK